MLIPENVPDLPVPSAQWYFEQVQQSPNYWMQRREMLWPQTDQLQLNISHSFHSSTVLFIDNESAITSAAVGSATGTYTVRCFRGLH